MSHLKRVEIDGFKGLRSFESTTNNISIITGRNNTGKTSILEAVDLAFNPNNFDQYRPHLDGLFNIHQNKITVNCYFDDDQRELQINTYDENKAMKIYSEQVTHMLEQDYPYPIDVYNVIFTGSDEDMEKFEKFQEVLSEAVVDRIASAPKQIRQKLSNNVFKITRNGDTYNYVYFSSYHREVGHFILEERLESIIDEIEDEEIPFDVLPDDLVENIDDFIGGALHRFFTREMGQGYFLDNPPDDNRLSFIRSPMLDVDPSEGEDDEEDVAVKKTKVRDYLRDHGIVDGLEDFDFDKLVIEEDDGRHSEYYQYMGDGFKTMVGILWQVDVEEKDIILLEEPENHMHPGYIDQLIPFLIQTSSEQDIQLFITTHNIDFIRRFFSDRLEDTQANYLEDNLQIIQLTESIPKTMDYDQAKKDLEELDVDLRGI